MELELDKVRQSINGCKRVLIQLPAGLRQHFKEIAKIVIDEGAEPIIWAGTCYGACDLPEFKADLLIHFGHDEFFCTQE